MKNCKLIALLAIFPIFLLLACSSTSKVSTSATESLEKEYTTFLESNEDSTTLYHVLLFSDGYLIGQMNHQDVIVRNDDQEGDKFIISEMKRFDKVDDVRDGVFKVWLYPDSGAIMRIRPVKTTYIREIDELILMDLQRWSYSFPTKIVEPTEFEIHYKVVLRKTLSDEKIMEDVRNKMLENTGSL